MKRIAATTSAVALALAMTASAQQTTVQTTQSSAGEAKQVSFTGCLAAGTETRTYVLDKAVPVTTTRETVGTSGTTTTTTTSYMLVPGEKVEIQQQQVGRKVEITGMLIPASESKTTTTTTGGAPPSAPSTTVTEKTTSQRPQFRVMSIKELAATCD